MRKKTRRIQPEHGHYFLRTKGVWTCACGAQRDKHGKPIKARPLRAV